MSVKVYVSGMFDADLSACLPLPLGGSGRAGRAGGKVRGLRLRDIQRRILIL